MQGQGELYIGLMSGTSVDGIDATLVEIKSSSNLKVIETLFTPFDDDLRHKINSQALNNEHLKQCLDSELHVELCQHYAQASLNLIKKAGVKPSDICAIANHGQTVKHEPNAHQPFSLQLGDPQLIANQTNITTIGYFRQDDLAVGGQGAPLMPAFHRAVLSQSDKNERYVLNIGGIANVTQLNENTIGFDTGPGNTLLDQWIMQHKNKKYDESGSWAKSGRCIPELLSSLLSDPYFSLAFPKSTGTDYFNLEWLHKRHSNIDQYQAEDVQATLLSLSVNSMANCIKALATSSAPFDVFVCGGGAHNQTMMTLLAKELPNGNITTTSEIGIPADWVESAGFAWLGFCKVHNIPSNLPSVTGAKKAVCLGKIYHPAN